MVVKTTHEILPWGETQIAAIQVPLTVADDHYSEPGVSSVRYESDFVPYKPICDVIVNGSAHSPSGRRAGFVDVTFEFGSIRKTVRVFGDRVWRSSATGPPKPSSPEPFVRIPLVWERAFGGSDLSDPDPGKHAWEMRNPIGCGFFSRSNSKSIIGFHVPNIEDPRDLIGSWVHRPAPQGFGFIGHCWQQRARYAGTFDQTWLQERFPFLPDDFDDRYFQSAPPDQTIPYPAGGESVRLINFTADGIMEFRVPKQRVPVVVPFPDGEESRDAILDTIVIEPDARRVILIRRTSFPCRCKPTDVDEIRVGEPTPAWLRAEASSKAFVDWRRFQPPKMQ